MKQIIQHKNKRNSKQKSYIQITWEKFHIQLSSYSSSLLSESNLLLEILVNNFTVHFPIHGNLIYLRLRWSWPMLVGRSFALKNQIKLCCTSAIPVFSQMHYKFILDFSCLNNRIISGVTALLFHSPKTLEVSICMEIV